jgi:hypothetical protein
MPVADPFCERVYHHGSPGSASLARLDADALVILLDAQTTRVCKAVLGEQLTETDFRHEADELPIRGAGYAIGVRCEITPSAIMRRWPRM